MESSGMNRIVLLAGWLMAAVLVSPAAQAAEEKKMAMELGEFSVSLTVKDLQASQAFYEKLGFTAVRHDEPEAASGGYGTKWLILRNGTATIGLFQGMFEKNTLTFNPTDVRGIQRKLKEQGVSFVLEADDKTQGPAAAVLLDPDGNPVLLDQH